MLKKVISLLFRSLSDGKLTAEEALEILAYIVNFDEPGQV